MIKKIAFRIYNPVGGEMVESGSTPMMLYSFFKSTAVFNTRDRMEYQQFTGLLDKSGVEIFEGDFLRFTDVSGHGSGTGIVVWCNSRFGYLLKNYSINLYDALYDFDNWNTEVIGNEMENPELLKEEK